MMLDPQLDPMGSLILELRADMEVATLVVDRVRGWEPAPGDIQPAGKYKALIILTAADLTPEPRVPVTFATYYIRCYGSTPQNAWAVYGAVVRALHMRGPRVKTNGLGFYLSSIVSGGEQDKDPDTSQPLVHGVLSLIATTQVVTP